MRFLATTTKGLEEVCQREIQAQIPEVEILEILSKRVIFSFDGDILQLKKIKTADDVDFLLNYSPNSPVKLLEIFQIKKLLSKIRPIRDTFSLTISQKNSKFEIGNLQRKLISELTQNAKLRYQTVSGADLPFRLWIDGDNLSLSIPIFAQPLSFRAYKTESRLGALKPSIAAAMVFLVKQNESEKFIDLFCGSGTILAESYAQDLDIFGSDIDPIAISISKINLNNLKIKGLDDRIRLYDAMHTKWNQLWYDALVSNLPWNKHLKLTSVTELYKKTLEEGARILKPEGRFCCLVYNPELFLKLAQKYFPSKTLSVIQIKYLDHEPSIVYTN